MKQKLLAGEPAFGVSIMFPSPHIVDIVGRLGFDSLDTFLWSFVDSQTRHNTFQTLTDIPAQTDESRAMSKALRAYGFTFVGPTICYAFMQSAGLVNDHITTCFRY